MLLVGGALAGCAGTAADDPFARLEPKGPAVRLHVLNRSFNDATIWAVYAAERVRLGTVTGMTDVTFELPRRPALEPVAFEFDVVAGSRCRTAEQIADPGVLIELEIQPDPWTMWECS